jgi:prepilin-type N-terminal cleavage/methylation domain-containing protein
MKKGFTLIELMIAIGIFLGILGIVFTFFNPIEFSKRQRDIKRINDLNSLASAIETCIAVNPNCNLGENDNFIYISVPYGKEDIPSTTTDATGKIWFINTVTSSDLYNINGTGWLPVDLSTLRYSPLSSLPVDPINSFSQKYFYSYVFKKDTKEFEINANLEYSAFRKDGRSDKTSKDGGSDLEIYEVGNNKCLIYNTLYGDITTTTCGYVISGSGGGGSGGRGGGGGVSGVGGELIDSKILYNATATTIGVSYLRLDLDSNNLYFTGVSGHCGVELYQYLGRLDFDLNNIEVTSTGDLHIPRDIKVKEGYIYVGGYNCNGEWRVEKRATSTFSIWGAVTSGTFSSGITSLTIDKDDNLFLAGYKLSNDYDWALELRDSNLYYLITSTIESITASGNERITDIASDDDYIYVVGFYTTSSPFAHNVWRVEKRDKSLRLIKAEDFCSLAPYSCVPYAIAIDDNYLYIAGSEGGLWRVEKRNKEDLSLVWAVTEDPTSYSDVPYGIAVDCEGVYIAGTQAADSDYPKWRIEKRSLWGDLGWATTSDYGKAYDIAVNDEGVFIGGVKNIGGNYYFAIEKRSRGAPECNTTFNKTFDNIVLYEAATTSDGYYLIGGYTYTGTATVLRLNRSGMPVAQFNYAPSSGFKSLIVDGDYFVGAGYTYSYGTGTPTTSNAYIVKASATSGAIVWEKYFGDINPSSYDYINQIKKAPDGNYVGVGASFNDIWVIKISSSTGDIIWQKQIIMPYGGVGKSIDIEMYGPYGRYGDGNYIIGGYIGSSPNGFIMKINSSTGDVICSSTQIANPRTYEVCYGPYCISYAYEHETFGIESLIMSVSGKVLGIYNETKCLPDAPWKCIYNGVISKFYSSCTYTPFSETFTDSNIFLKDIIEASDYLQLGTAIYPAVGFGSNQGKIILIIYDYSIAPEGFKERERYYYDRPYQSSIENMSLIQTPDGGYLIVNSSDYQKKSQIIKTDAHGNVITSQTLGFQNSLKKFFKHMFSNILKSLFPF